MKLFIIGNRGLWGDCNSHPLPAVVGVFPRVDLGTAYIDGEPISITDGQFTLDNIADGVHTLTVNGKPCERFFCRSTGGVKRAVQAADDWRAILPYLIKIDELEKAVARLESQINQPDIFG